MASVPGVVGDTQAAATSAITVAGLTVGTVTMQSSSTVASGSVISENPAAAASVASGSAVSLVVSSGPAMVSVPNVVGDTQAAATSAITGAGLTVGTVTMQSSSTVASGSVISENPAAAASVASGSAVSLVVSSGPAMVSVPNVVGDAQAAATSAITVAGLTVGTVTMQSSSTVASGSVISENPAAAASVASGTAVNLVVSSGLVAAAWTWMGGSDLIGASGVYGSPGIASASGVPGARSVASAWTDSSGNFWLFGGECYDSSGTGGSGYCNDLWKYTPSRGEWTWVGGSNVRNGLAVYGTQGVASASNVPGARVSAVSWTDLSGNFWIFGGQGCNADGLTCGLFNDLWKYNPSSAEWTWVSGSDVVNGSAAYGTRGVASASSVPGGRTGEVTWTDAAGNLWLFGGEISGAICSSVVCGELNDLWKFNPNTGEWTWVSGSNAACVVSGQVTCPGVYGTQGVASASNVPGGRNAASAWTDSSGNFWIFGGNGADSAGSIGELNDLWKYSPSTGQWIWIGGANVLNLTNLVNTGVYGSQGVAAASNLPGGRFGAVSWTDRSGNFWMLGGNGVDSLGEPGELNDLWKYSPSSGEWTWVGGLNVIVQVPPGQTQGVYIDQGVYGTQGVASANNMPGGRVNALGWTDSSGNLWLFCGDGLDSTNGSIGLLNDLWRFTPAQ